MSYTSNSAADRLAAVRNAIDKVLSVQSFSRGEMQQRLAELKTLREMEKELQSEVAREGRSGFGFSLLQVDRPGSAD
ncbi:peptidylprolyl isomerase [Thalassoroseus pseudoceratinae]|uniref:peptidylprolyl isomerase n=1 Tax=Thalassoroseus pseudoceratinae TaxID=2713176 RepID=UPI00141F754D|nr:peptidylprolyl isomerase [Thalassoroseus pseudoceratinae]